MIADERGHEVEADAVGEICVRGTGMFRGYYGTPDATQGGIPAGRVVQETGDWGKRSGDG